MTRMLASVQSAEEARAALAAGVDLIDLKDPSTGVLGAVHPDLIRMVVHQVKGLCPVSATAGDLPMDPPLLTRTVDRTGATGVDYVKVGLFPDPRVGSCITVLETLARRGLQIVGVMFADLGPLPADARDLARAGFAGIMLDTADKSSGSLRAHMGTGRLGAFVRSGRDAGLLVGLAGSLQEADVKPLAALAPDLLGFRRALCSGSSRTSPVDPRAVARIRTLLASADSGAALAAEDAARHPEARRLDRAGAV